MNFVKMNFGDFGREFESLKIERLCINWSCCLCYVSGRNGG